MKVGLYIRVSTEEQAMHGLSIEAQTAALREWAKRGKMQVVGEYVDAGLSARKPAEKRPELQRLLNDVRSKKVEMIVFTKLDRWFRNVGEYYKVQDVLERHNASWKAIHEDYETVSAAGRLKVNIMLAVNQDEADRTSERIVSIFERKKERGEVISGSVPPGYKIVEKKYAIDDKAVDMVRDMFAHYKEHRSGYATQRYMLNHHGFKRDISTLKRMLQNPLYKGERYGIKDYAPAIISPVLFDEVQEIMATRATRHSGKPTGRIYLFKGLLKCSECGHIMGGTMGRGKYYYRCANHTYTGACQRAEHVGETHIEQYLLDHVLMACDAYNVELSKASKSKPQLDEALVRRKMIKLKDLYLNDLIEKEEYQRDYTILKSELDEINKLKAITPVPFDINSMKDALSAYNTLDRTEKQSFWNVILKEIHSYPDGQIAFTLRHT